MHDLAALIGPTRTASIRALSRDADPRTIRRWLAAGRLVLLHPGWVTLPEFADDWTVRARAATGYTGGVLSHMSALAVHGVVDYEVTRLDVTVRISDRLRSTKRVRVHRSDRPCPVVRARGLDATSVARAVVDTWGDAHQVRAIRGYDRVARDALLRAVRERLVSVEQVDAERARVPRLPGSAALRELLDEVRGGVRSYLEGLGVRAFRRAGLPAPVLQYGIPLGYRTLHVDAAWPEVRLAVEFDGAAFHAGPEDWQRDLRRDAALAAAGWVVLRFSYADITQRPAFCAAQVAAVYRTRLDAGPQAGTSPTGMSASGTS